MTGNGNGRLELPAEMDAIADEVAKQVDQFIHDTVVAWDFEVVDEETGISFCFRQSHLAAQVVERLKAKYGIK